MDEQARGGQRPETNELTVAEAAFAARLGAALRADAATPADDLEARVMQCLRTDATVLSPRPLRANLATWWTRRRDFSISPLGGVALAASFAGLVALGTLAAVRDLRPAPGAVATAARVDTVHLVRFVIQQPGARRVSLVGDFNGWQADAMPLEASPDGSVWSLTLPLQAGRYEYAFIVDGERWVADPAASRVRDEFGGETSVLRLAGGQHMM